VGGSQSDDRNIGRKAGGAGTPNPDGGAVSEATAVSRRLCERTSGPLIDATLRSIEETAATLLALFNDRKRRAIAETWDGLPA